MTITRTTVLKTLSLHRAQLERYGVTKLALFGSVARGNAGRRSDIDILVQFNKATFDGYMDLKQYLELLFRRKVDLVLADNLKPDLKPQITRQAVHVTGL